MMPHGLTATDIVIIIGAITTAITSTIAALKANKVDKKQDIADTKLTATNNKLNLVTDVSQTNTQKLDEIHDKVNGNLSESKKDCDYQLRILDKLRSIYPIDVEEARRQVDVELADIGNRRKDDKG